MKHTTSHQYDIKVREAFPKLEKSKKGTLLLCPFCDTPHPLYPDGVSECGTTVKVTAVQSVIPARRAKRDKLTCLKCRKTEGGDMVKFMSGFIHMEDCAPENVMLTELPKFSRLARFAYSLPEGHWLRARLERRYGMAKMVGVVDGAGNDTGKVLGYFFYKKQVSNGKHSTTGTGQPVSR